MFVTDSQWKPALNIFLIKRKVCKCVIIWISKIIHIFFLRKLLRFCCKQWKKTFSRVCTPKQVSNEILWPGRTAQHNMPWRFCLEKRDMHCSENHILHLVRTFCFRGFDFVFSNSKWPIYAMAAPSRSRKKQSFGVLAGIGSIWTVRTRPVTRGGEAPPTKFFNPPGKICWT